MKTLPMVFQPFRDCMDGVLNCRWNTTAPLKYLQKDKAQIKDWCFIFRGLEFLLPGNAVLHRLL